MNVPVTITFRQAREAGACTKDYRRVAMYLGGVRAWGEDTPIPVSTVIDVIGVDGALWCLNALNEGRVRRLWACDCAERVAYLAGDDRVAREAIRVSRLYAAGLASGHELWAAQAAPEAAARAAADAAARAAARAADWAADWAAADAAARAAEAAARAAAWAAKAAEREWQAERLRHYLDGGT